MHQFNGTRGVGAGLLITCLLSGRAAVAESNKAPSPKIDPKAEKVIRDMAKYIGGAHTLTADIRVSMKMTAAGERGDQKLRFHNAYRFTMQRPNKFAIVLKKGKMATKMSCDGKQLHVYVPKVKEYKTSKAPDSLEGLPASDSLDSLGLVGFAFGGPTIIPMLLAGRPYDKLVENVKTAEYLGTVESEGVKCHRLKFVQDRFDWEMWVSNGQKPLFKKITSNMTGLLAKRGLAVPGHKNSKAEVTVAYENWAIDTKLPAGTFTFAPPPGAKKIAPRAVRRRRARAPQRAALGKLAPDFEIPLLEGGRLRPSDHEGKHIVILDFWATWCPPCRKALPILIGVAERYKPKGVVFYAVNLRESPSQIRSFLSKQGLKCNVGLDRRGNVASRFNVRGIPQTVILGKDGTVQVVHVGLLPDLKGQLKRELDALLAGKDLASQKDRSH